MKINIIKISPSKFSSAIVKTTITKKSDFLDYAQEMGSEKYQNQGTRSLDPNHFQVFLAGCKSLAKTSNSSFWGALLYFWGAKTFRQRKLPVALAIFCRLDNIFTNLSVNGPKIYTIAPSSTMFSEIFSTVMAYSFFF